MSRARILIEAVSVLKPVAVDTEMDKKFTEWQELKRQIEVLNLVSEKIASRLGELESDLKDVAKTAVAQTVIIDKAVINYKERHNTSVRYAELFKKAMEIATADQRKVLEEYKEVVTNKSVTDSLKITDPDLEIHLEKLRALSVDDLFTQLNSVKKIPAEPPAQPAKKTRKKKVSEGNITDFVKHLVATAKAAFNKLRGAFSKSEKSANDLLHLSVKEA